MSVFKCKMCGAAITIRVGETVAVCEYCDTQQTLPRLDNEKTANLYDRANHFRRNNEYDKAMGYFERILNENPDDAEAYWSILLCRYGIEYVKDPVSEKRVPTINRTQMTSIFADEDYKSAIKHADLTQKEVYEREAKVIDEIQKGILEISNEEAPFDVFICYKETDENGRRTPDSVLANDLYHQLTNEGFKVFFSRITLEDKLGAAYEPYIFAALNSAKVMVVIGTQKEYFQSVWVKNEWSRYLALIKNGAEKMLIPAYRDMDPYDLPEEFSHLQAQDMAKLGFIQDLIRGIKKIVYGGEKNSSVIKNVSQGNEDATERMCKRGNMALQDAAYEEADKFFEKALDYKPECAEAYLGKALVQEKVGTLAELINKRIESGEVVDCFEWNHHDGLVENIRKMQYEKEQEYWDKGRYISKALLFSEGELNRRLQEGRQEVYAIMEKRIAEAARRDISISENALKEAKKSLTLLANEIEQKRKDVAYYQKLVQEKNEDIRKMEKEMKEEEEQNVTIEKQMSKLYSKDIPATETVWWISIAVGAICFTVIMEGTRLGLWGALVYWCLFSCALFCVIMLIAAIRKGVARIKYRSLNFVKRNNNKNQDMNKKKFNDLLEETAIQIKILNRKQEELNNFEKQYSDTEKKICKEEEFLKCCR